MMSKENIKSSPLIFLYGSSLGNLQDAADLDLIIVSEKPVDVCVYTPEEWEELNSKGEILCRGRTVLYPSSYKKLRQRPLLKKRIL